MRFSVPLGPGSFELEIADAGLVLPRESPTPNLHDPAAALADALEHPFRFPPLRQALTPDDHIAVVVADAGPHTATLLGVILDTLTAAGVEIPAITLLTPADAEEPRWRADLPPIYRRVAVQVHDPANTRTLCYLATTREGRRIYLNRTLVEAEQVVVLCGRRYDPILGMSGGETSLYPAFGDAQAPPGKSRIRPLPFREEPAIVRIAHEVAWLVGAPFFVQVIEGSEDGIAAFVTGTQESLGEGQQRQDARWQRHFPEPANLILALLPGSAGFSDLANAASRALSVLAPNGRLVLLTESNSNLGAAAEFLSRCEDPEEALRKLGREPEPELISAYLWARTTLQTRVMVHSPLDDDTVESLFATPLEDPSQVQRLIERAGKVLVLPDAHKTLPLLAATDLQAGTEKD